MVKKRLVEYAEKCLKKKYSVETIRKQLVAKGWKDEDVIDAINVAQGLEPVIRKPRIGLWITVTGSLIIIMEPLITIISGFFESLINLTNIPAARGFAGNFSADEIFKIFENSADAMIIGLVLGILIMAFSYFGHHTGETKKACTLIIGISVISIFTVSGYFIGAVLCIIGGFISYRLK